MLAYVALVLFVSFRGPSYLLLSRGKKVYESFMGPLGNVAPAPIRPQPSSVTLGFFLLKNRKGRGSWKHAIALRHAPSLQKDTKYGLLTDT